MSRKLVASLIGWLLASLLIIPSVWAATNKDKTPTNKGPQTNTIRIPKHTAERYSRPRWRTGQEMLENLTRSKMAEQANYFPSVYGTAAGLIDNGFFGASPAAVPIDAFFDTVAIRSRYDIVSNHRGPRFIAINYGTNPSVIAQAKDDVAMHFTFSSTSAFTNRWSTAFLWVNGGLVGGMLVASVQEDPPQLPRAGFVGATFLPHSGKMVMFAHHAQAPRGTWVAIEKTAGGFEWDAEIHAPDSIYGDADPGIWPTAAGGFMMDDANDYDADGVTVNDTIDIIHTVSNQGNLSGTSVDHYIYGRLMDSASSPTVWKSWRADSNYVDKKRGLLADSGTRISPVVVASHRTPKVALVYTEERDCNYTAACSDIRYIESTNGGQDWVSDFSFATHPGTLITTFNSGATTRPSGDLSAVYSDSSDPQLVVSWVQWVTFDEVANGSSSEADIFVWTDEWGVRKAVDGNFDQMPVAAIIPDPRRQTVNYPHIAVHDGTTGSKQNYFYLTYLQYGGNDPASYNDRNADNYLNGEIYIAASTNRGKTWSKGVNLTNSKSPGCTFGTITTANCPGICYSSAAERANDTVHIAYMYDYYSGSVAAAQQAQAFATDNSMIYRKFPAYEPTKDTIISCSPTIFEDLDPASVLNDSFKVENIGNQDMVVSSVVEAIGSTWLTINAGDAAGFTILEGDPAVQVNFTLDDATLLCGVYIDSLIVNNNSENNNRVVITVRMVVDPSDPYVVKKFAEFANSKAITAVSNVGNLAHQNDTTGFYRLVVDGAKTDTTNNIYDASVFMAVRASTAGNTKEVGRYVFNEFNMIPLDTLAGPKDTTLLANLAVAGTDVVIPPATYRKATAKYTAFLPEVGTDIWPGSYYRYVITQDYWMHKSGGTNPVYPFVLSTLKLDQVTKPCWWGGGNAFATTDTVYVGMAGDFDVFIEDGRRTGSDNYGRPNPLTGLMWVRGADTSNTYANDSVLQEGGHMAFVAYLADTASGVDPYGMHIVSNPSYIYPEEGYQDDSLYKIAADNAVDTTIVNVAAKTFKYFHPAGHPINDTIPTDINVVMTFKRLVPTLPASVSMAFVVGVTSHRDTIFTTVPLIAGGLEADANDVNRGCNNLATAYNAFRNELGLDILPSLATKLRCLTTVCTALAGDASGNGTWALNDAIGIVNYAFDKLPGRPPCANNDKTCWYGGITCRGDWSGNNAVALNDAIQAVNYAFSKACTNPGAAPCATTPCCWRAKNLGVCCNTYPLSCAPCPSP